MSVDRRTGLAYGYLLNSREYHEATYNIAEIDGDLYDYILDNFTIVLNEWEDNSSVIIGVPYKTFSANDGEAMSINSIYENSAKLSTAKQAAHKIFTKYFEPIVGEKGAEVYVYTQVY